MKFFLLILFFTVSYLVGGQVNLIQNGNFTSPNTAWIKNGFFQYDNRLSVYHSPPAYSYLADLNGLPANNISGQLYQDFFVPSGQNRLTIIFWFRITTSETDPVINDTLRVSIVDPSNPTVEYLIDRLSNLDANTAYAVSGAEIPSIQAGRAWRIRFVGGTNGTWPTVFRVDDVEVYAGLPASMNCINWSGGIHPDPMIDTAMNNLCNYGIISNNQNALTVNNAIQKIEVARLLGKALLGNTPADFMDNFPNIFPEVDNLSLDNKRYVKLMLYLEYKSKISAPSGGDDIAPFSRDYFHTNLSATIKKSDAVKALIETWDFTPFMPNYDPTSGTTGPLVCDMPVNNRNLGWVQRAIPLGLLTNIISTPCGVNGINFGTDGNISYGQFYVLLSRILAYNRPNIGYDDFFTPNLFYLSNLNNNISLERGVFNEYNDNGFVIPSGGLGLEFSHSYHSSLTEIPVLANDVENENKYLKAKLQPLGGGWTHSYSMFIKPLDNNGTPPERMLIYWPDGIIHSFLVNQNKYETKGLTDKLTIDSLTATGQPGKITIRKGRITYLFRNIDPAGYNVLSIAKITDANNNNLSFDYITGVAASPGFEPKLLAKVTDSYGNRSLNFSYWPGTNYLKTVKDTLGRLLTYYPNQYTHDLDSSADAKNQVTKYSYKVEVGTTAYRTHLLISITRPKGNIITNSYYSRKLKQTQSSNYTIKVNAVPDYRTAWTQQSSSVTQIQNNQSLTTNYIFDANGNTTGNNTETEKIQTIYDSENRPILQRDIDRGFNTKTSYDINGYVNRIVVIDSLYNDSTKYTYTNNQFGEITNIIDYNDDNWPLRETKIYRDNEGHPTTVVTNENTGGQIRHQYGYLNGQLVNYVSPTSFQTMFERNSFGNIARVIKLPNPAGQHLKSEYYFHDAASRLTGHVDFNGDTTTFGYDNNDNVISSQVDPAGLNLISTNTFDKNDNLIRIQSPKGNLTSLAYDFFNGDLIEESDGINKKRWKYNEDGTLDSFITKNNYQFKYLYYNQSLFPADSSLWGLLFSDGFTFFNYWNNTRAPKYVNNNNGKQNWFSYFGFNRGKWNKPDMISTQGFFTGSTPDFVTYSYDRLERPTIIAYPTFGNRDYNYGHYYDQATKNLSLVQDRNTLYNFAKYEYRYDGSVSKETYGNGDTIFHHYDVFDREDSIWAKNKNNILLYSISAKFDNNGKHIEENTRIFYQGQEVSSLPVLTSGQTTSHTYEATRNRILIGDGRTYTSSGAGEVTTISNPSYQFTWNQYGQITNLNINGVSTPIEYDALGNRKRLGNTYFVVDQQNTGNMVMEAQQNTTPISAYVYGRGLVARVDPASDSIFYYHFDFRGSVIAITNKNGDLVKAYQYEPYGSVYNSAGSLSWKNPFQYLGKHGVETDLPDLYYMKARYYQPSTGRFLSEDPVWANNLFIYGNDDPINNIDPDGREANPWNLKGSWQGVRESIAQGRPLEAGLYTLTIYGHLASTALDLISVKGLVKSSFKKTIVKQALKSPQQIGYEYEEKLAGYFKSKGFEVKRHYNYTADGGVTLPFSKTRIVDLALFKDGRHLFNIESKYNTSRYLKRQQALDEFFEMKTGIKTYHIRFPK